MKKYLFVVTVLLGLIHTEFAAASGNWLRPEVLNVVPDRVFISTPFDSNEDVEIFIGGQFLNSCFRAGRATAQIDSDRKIIYINNEVYFYESSWCLQVVKSYVHTLHLGFLSPGTYQIISWDNRGQERVFGELSVFLAE